MSTFSVKILISHTYISIIIILLYKKQQKYKY